MTDEVAELRFLQNFADLIRGPDMETAFFAAGVGIDARSIAAVSLSHGGFQPAGNARGGLFQFGAVPAFRTFRVQRQQLCIVVEHFFEVGNGPVLIDTVAEEAAVQVVTQAASCHALQCESKVCQQTVPGFQFPHRSGGFEQGRLRELRRSTESPVHGVVPCDHLRRRGTEKFLRERNTQFGFIVGFTVVNGMQRFQQFAVLLPQFIAMFLVPLPQRLQHFGERRHAISPLGRKISAGEEGHLVPRIEKDR